MLSCGFLRVRQPVQSVLWLEAWTLDGLSLDLTPLVTSLGQVNSLLSGLTILICEMWWDLMERRGI